MTQSTNRDELREKIAKCFYDNRMDETEPDDFYEEHIEFFDTKEVITRLVDLIATRETEARLNEARHWDEHILGSPRKVTVNDKAKKRIKDLEQGDIK